MKLINYSMMLTTNKQLTFCIECSCSQILSTIICPKGCFCPSTSISVHMLSHSFIQHFPVMSHWMLQFTELSIPMQREGVLFLLHVSGPFKVPVQLYMCSTSSYSTPFHVSQNIQSLSHKVARKVNFKCSRTFRIRRMLLLGGLQTNSHARISWSGSQIVPIQSLFDPLL